MSEAFDLTLLPFLLNFAGLRLLFLLLFLLSLEQNLIFSKSLHLGSWQDKVQFIFAHLLLQLLADLGSALMSSLFLTISPKLRRMSKTLSA
jgi:hypothetical protein